MAAVPEDVLHDVLVYFNDNQLFESQFVCRRFRLVCSTKLVQSRAKSQRPPLLSMKYWTVAVVFVLSMVLVFPLALLEAAEALSILQEASRPIEHGLSEEVSATNTCKIRCDERLPDKCRFECNVKDGTHELTHTPVHCDEEQACTYQVRPDWDRIFERYAPSTRPQMNRWKDYIALLVFLAPMVFLPTVALFMDFLWQSRGINRSAHLFVARNALQRLQEKRRALVKRLSLFIACDVGLFAFVGLVLCFCIANDSSASGFFEGGTFLFSFLHVYAAFAYALFVNAPSYLKRNMPDFCIFVVIFSLIGTMLVTLFSAVFFAVIRTLCF